MRRSIAHRHAALSLSPIVEAHMMFFLTKKVRRDQTEYPADAQTSKISNIVMLKMLLARRAW